jgi:hypothetical protein
LKTALNVCEKTSDEKLEHDSIMKTVLGKILNFVNEKIDIVLTFLPIPPIARKIIDFVPDLLATGITKAIKYYKDCKTNSSIPDDFVIFSNQYQVFCRRLTFHLQLKKFVLIKILDLLKIFFLVIKKVIRINFFSL